MPDDRIYLMLADEHACDPRNGSGGPGRIYNSEGEYAASVIPWVEGGHYEVDFLGANVSPASFLQLISGRNPLNTPANQILPPDRQQNLLIYITGHGGDGFIKFHDKEELSYSDFAIALRDAYSAGRFGRLVLVVDTCQAHSVATEIAAVGLNSVIVLTTSIVGQSSWATGFDPTVGLSTADGFTRAIHEGLSGFQHKHQHQEEKTDIQPFGLMPIAPESCSVRNAHAPTLWKNVSIDLARSDKEHAMDSTEQTLPYLAELCSQSASTSTSLPKRRQQQYQGLSEEVLQRLCGSLSFWNHPSVESAKYGWEGALESSYVQVARKVLSSTRRYIPSADALEDPKSIGRQGISLAQGSSIAIDTLTQPFSALNVPERKIASKVTVDEDSFVVPHPNASFPEDLMLPTVDTARIPLLALLFGEHPMALGSAGN